MRLVLDLGNSALKAAWFDGLQLRAQDRHDATDPAARIAWLGEVLLREPVGDIVAASVVPALTQVLRSFAGPTPLRLAGVLALLHWIFLVPLMALAVGALSFLEGLGGLRPLLLAALPGVAALALLRFLLARRFQQAALPAVLLHPLSICALTFIALDSAAKAHGGAVSWRGRLYGRAAGALPATPAGARR